VAARELVPGDVIRIRLGDIVPADARLLEGDPMEVDQSALPESRCLSRARLAKRSTRARSSVKAGPTHSSMDGSEHLLREDRPTVQEVHIVSHFQRAVLKIGDYLIVLR